MCMEMVLRTWRGELTIGFNTPLSTSRKPANRAATHLNGSNYKLVSIPIQDKHAASLVGYMCLVATYNHCHHRDNVPQDAAWAPCP
eukprot:CAMPEP_0202908648 /NCGR_PEP_ID=MMETSP1392-20130828/46763_1 /ASSEMBLY_ACC=CAM_ASM_000868 /TAXON_ID=225041 /ORGANISM="Chlamydomonas chlamydogama, Strain SAG 11-48b" /LENGTH=85 /DNA_ID=CAMNT_0049598085 /DNA_START=288 /DNA_END=545 /DNA_ORIENTATION=-